MLIDTALLPLGRICPITQASGLDALKNLIKFSLTNFKSIMLRFDCPLSLTKVQVDSISGFYHHKMANMSSSRHSKQLCQKICSQLFIPRINYSVIKFNTHISSLFFFNMIVHNFVKLCLMKVWTILLK